MESKEREVRPDAWRALAQRLGVEAAALRAVAQVESAGSGFLPPPDNRPKVLFEGHAFHRLTQGRFDKIAPNLSYPKWDRSKYSKTLAGEWKRLDEACELDRTAALQSASWGTFQIMGFNYGLCGFANVELFVADQEAGATQQLESFARFIAREAFLSALRNRDWAAFARAYNGPGFAQNRYDTKLEQAYEALAADGAAAMSGAPAAGATDTGERRTARTRKGDIRRRRADAAAATAAAAAALPGAAGRPTFAAVRGDQRRKPAVRRPVKADPIDLRDWLYRPNISVVPPLTLVPSDPPSAKDQRTSNACTGFALSTVIEYLLRRADRPFEAISGYMLYSMARRYDEWAENDDADEGSSLRGALKGWSRHGASVEPLWDKLDMPAASKDANEDWWFDAVKRPLGAYYRLTPAALTDIQVALAETNAVYASALIHSGWDEQKQTGPRRRRGAQGELPIIRFRPGEPGGGHAFAIVGYTDEGFIVHNSWGDQWGHRGLAVLTYADWRLNAMDCWVVQLGVVTKEHLEVARNSTLRTSASGGDAVIISSNSGLATHEVSAFVVDMERGGRLSKRGQFRTKPEDLEALLDIHVLAACKRWGIGARDPIDVALYAHAGFVNEDEAALSAQTWIPLLYSNRIFPVYLMWDADGISTMEDLLARVLGGEASRVDVRRMDALDAQFAEWKDQRIEGLARRPGSALWRQMTKNARDLSRTSTSGVRQLFEVFQARRKKLPAIRLHLIGHSAGAIVQAYLGAQALEAGFTIDTMSLIAPAVSVDLFDEQLGVRVEKEPIRVLLAHLTDAAERDDRTCQPYGHSLLYLASRAFGEHPDTPMLGMEKFLVPAVVTQLWGARVTRLASPGAALHRGDRLTVATTHRDLDDDPAVQDAVVAHIRRLRSTAEVVRPRRGPASA